MAKIQSITGMPDLLPEQTAVWQHVEQTLRQLANGYGYQEIRFPILEKTELFKRSIGEVTDIVEKEMYTFADRSGDSLTLRPEGTAGCVRACLQNAMLDNQQVQKLWYQGPMFRYERPQKGRQRQFHQFGIEAFGVASPDQDAEVILLSARLWRLLGIGEHLKLELNSIGSLDARNRYKAALVDYLSQYRDQLDDDSQRRLDSNPLRILDSKHAGTQALLDRAPSLSDFLDQESAEHFEQLQQLLKSAGIGFVVNPRLVRGLDYYNKTVFEWTTTALGAQGTVCAGGRYDALVEQLGGKSVPAVGFGMGLERLTLLLEACKVPGASIGYRADAYMMVLDGAELLATRLAERLRDAMPSLRLQLHCGGGSYKSQIKKVDRAQADVVIVVDAQSQDSGQCKLRRLQDGQWQQQELVEEQLFEQLQRLFPATR